MAMTKAELEAQVKALEAQLDDQAAGRPPSTGEVTILVLAPTTEILRGCKVVQGLGRTAADSLAADYARTHRGFAVVESDGSVTCKR